MLETVFVVNERVFYGMKKQNKIRPIRIVLPFILHDTSSMPSSRKF